MEGKALSRVIKIVKRGSFLILMITAFLTVSVQAEVYDKVATQSQIVIFGLIIAGLSFAAARYKPWALLFTALLPYGFFYFLISDFLSGDLGPVILEEMGRFYVASGYVFALLIPISVCLGFCLRNYSRRPVDRKD